MSPLQSIRTAIRYSTIPALRFASVAAIAFASTQCHPATDAPKVHSPASERQGHEGTANGPTAPVTTAAAAKEAPAPKAALASIDTSAPVRSPVEPPSPPVAPPTPAPRPELPRGGREIFPVHRVVGFCGTPGAPALGRLAGNLTAKVKALQAQADKYGRRKVLPVLELIAVVVQGAPGNDGKWRRRVPDSVVDEYLQAARNAKALLLLNIQPGHSDFMTEAKHFEKYLRQPDVGIALDPEWAMKGKQRPGAIFGQTTGATINAVAEYLSSIVTAGDLPEKPLVFHQVNSYVLKDESVLVPHPGVVLIKSVDGLGPKGAKIKTYNFLVKTMPSSVHAGFKLFFDEDTTNGGKLMTPEEVMALTPEPEYVMYE